MKKKRFSIEQIVAVLKQAELGMPVADLIRQVGISEQTFYRWKKQYAEMQSDQVRELKQLQEENGRLKKREQTGTRQASGNRPARRGGLNDPVTGSASVLRANMPDDPQARGYVFEDFSNVVAQFLQGTAIVRAAVIRWQMFD